MAADESNNPPQDEAPRPPTLQEVIARQRAELLKKRQAQAATQPPPAQPEASAPPPAPPAVPGPTAAQVEKPGPQMDDLLRSAEDSSLDLGPANLKKLSPSERAMVEQMLAPKPPVSNPPPAPAPGSGETWRQTTAAMPPARKIHFVHVLLVVNTAAAAVLVLGMFGVLPPLWKPHSVAAVPVPPPTSPVAETRPASRPAATEEVEPPLADASATLAEGQKQFARGDHAGAVLTFHRLLRHIPTQSDGQPPIRDFLQLRIAQCLVRLNRVDEADALFQSFSISSSPILALISNVWLAGLELSADQPMLARMRAYRAMGACGFLPGMEEMDRESQFLAVRGLTARALTMYNAPGNVDWGKSALPDPLEGLDEPGVLELLSRGAQRASAGALAPQVKKTVVSGGVRFEALSVGASLEELLARLSAESGCDVKYVDVPPSNRQKPVVLACLGWPEQRVFETACGSVGLIARFAGSQVQVYSPSSADNTRQERQMLLEECRLSWRRLFLRYPDDRRMGPGHFVLGMLSEQSGETLEAISEYQFTANRFARDKAAPESLLRAARLRMQIRDFASARADLSNLLDNYSDFPATHEAYLALAESSLEAGLTDEAVKVYRRLFQMEVSRETRSEACRGAGMSYFRQKDFANAAAWLSRYATSVRPGKGPKVVEACRVLAESHVALGAFADAVGAYQVALVAGPTPKENLDLLIALADAQVRKPAYSSALGALRQLEGQELSERQQFDVLTLRTRIYCGMGLPETAIDWIRRQQATLADPELKARAGVELAQCYAQAGQLSEAYDVLQGVLDELKGPQAIAASMRLADLCLQLSKPRQALTLATQLLGVKDLNNAQAAKIRQLLAKAHMALGDYEKAALAVAADASPTTQPGGPTQ